MKASKATPIWTIALIILLSANLGWISWNVYQRASLPAAVKQFRFEELHTNDMSGIGLFQARTDRPIWTQFTENGRPAIENYFFQGEDVFDVILKSNRPPVYNVYFHGPGKSVTWWLNAGGSSTFTERIYYDSNGNFSSNEVWWSQTWHTVERRDGTNGILVKGQWHRLAFDTNGMWTIEAPAQAR